MNADNIDGNASNFDRNPPVSIIQYDDSIRLFTAAYEQLFAMAYAYLRSTLNVNADLLIVGAGTGMEICAFGEQSRRWHFTGVDPSAEMLSIARDKIARREMEFRVKLFRGYTHDLPDAPVFDGATCILVMHFLPDDGAKLELLRSISKRLKSGAPLVLVDAFGDRNSESFARTVEAWKTYVKAKGVEPQSVDEGFSGQILKRIQFVPEERIIGLLDEAGFEKPYRFYTGFLYGGWLALKR